MHHISVQCMLFKNLYSLHVLYILALEKSKAEPTGQFDHRDGVTDRAIMTAYTACREQQPTQHVIKLELPWCIGCQTGNEYIDFSVRRLREQ